MDRDHELGLVSVLGTISDVRTLTSVCKIIHEAGLCVNYLQEILISIYLIPCESFHFLG